jgi:RNA polymerase sigma-70 factor (ECF subfamily)
MSEAAAFEPHRRALTGLAYRMLGSVSDAEDVVQDAFLRWHAASRADVAEPRAYLMRVVTRLCLDVLKSARARRETYVGPWLPEPVLDAAAVQPDTAGELAEDISVALLLALERLSPAERAAFLLHDVFDRDFTEIAATLGRSETACRQLASRARAHVRASPRRFAADPAEGQRLAAAFMLAAQTGDVRALTGLLAEDATLHSDGGGVRIAALNVIRGADRIARFTVGVVRKGEITMDVEPALMNGLPGFVLTDSRGDVRTVAFEVADGMLSAIYLVANPNKLKHLRPVA